MIRNPILTGFNPDPSICRVGGDHFIATSTFEWYPGVQIHHSTDLVNWRLVKRPLERAAQLDMRGNPDSGGIWAPCLSYADGMFWLVYTDVKRLDGNFKDSAQLHRDCAFGRRAVVRSGLRQLSRASTRSLFHDDDGKEVVPEHGLEPCLAWRRRQPEAPVLCRHTSAGSMTRWPKARRPGRRTSFCRQSPRAGRGAASLQARTAGIIMTTAEGGTGY